MGTQPGASLDAWLRDGGVVVTSSDRTARALQADYHRRRKAEGLLAWPAPKIIDWKSFARNAWEERNADGRLLLNSIQELAIWSGIVHNEQHLPTALPSSVRRLAMMAMEAHDLICSYAPHLLRHQARVGWDLDAGEFSRWLAQFSTRCEDSLLSSSRMPLELISLLRSQSDSRVPLRVAGFDHILPVQRELFDTWGAWQAHQIDTPAAQVMFHSVNDRQAELEACAFWCHRQISKDPKARILVITQHQAELRGEIERAFLRFRSPGEEPLFEFSLGVPLSGTPYGRSALLLLQWLRGNLSETELDWLFSCDLCASPDESAALQLSMRTLRRVDRQRPHWLLPDFLNQPEISSLLPSDWARRMITAQRSLKESPQKLNPIEWADKIPHLLGTLGWRGMTPQSSGDFQAQRRWTQALDAAGSLGFDGQRLSWNEFLAELHYAVSEILFAPQSIEAPIQITGSAESAGLSADAFWFLGADEESWPAVGSAHPFLPVHLQREFAMPHASHQQDWNFSETITNRLLASASVVHFSFALQSGDVESRPSRLISRLTSPQTLPADLLPPQHGEPAAISIEDFSRIPYPAEHLQGGSAVLSYQSQCPFKAFATAQLGAQRWEPAEAGLSAKQRGQLLHDVLRSIWSGPRSGIKTHRDLVTIDNADLTAFARKHVRAAMQSAVPAQIREHMPTLYLELEETRLIRLITEWLLFEKTRLPFSVEAVEAKTLVTITGLTMNLRLDRVDRLHDGSQLVIDYKTGTVDPKSWDLPRPEDVQLPIYKLFGLAPLQPSLFETFGGPANGGLVFARVRTGNVCFAGRVADARETLIPELNSNSALVKRNLTAAEELAWKNYIEGLVQDFIRGRADLNPRDYPATCERCGLQSVCRIQDPANRSRFEQQELEPNDAIED